MRRRSSRRWDVPPEPRRSEKFRARQWEGPITLLWKEQVARFGEGQPMSALDRMRTAPTFASCAHTQRQLVEVETAHGVWGSELCVDCGRQVAGPECPHAKCSWQLDGKLLICDNCGTDCT